MVKNIAAILSADINEAEIKESLGAYNFKSPERAHSNFQTLYSYYDNEADFTPILTTLLNVLDQSADPDSALLYLVRFIETEDYPLKTLGELKENVFSLSMLITIFSFSGYFSEAVIRDKDFFYTLIEDDLAKLYDKDSLSKELETFYQEHKSDNYIKTLHNFQLRQLLRIFANDVMQEEDFISATKEISNLAEVILDFCIARNKEKIKKDISGVEFCVIAMGKLGGRELNYSSDIDVIFIYENKSSELKSYEIKPILSKLAQDVMRDCADTRYGLALYRVDARLRPEGSRGELVVSTEHALSYYFSRGRTWERQAFIKARAAAGDIRLGEHFLNELSSFVYSKYLSYEEIQSIKKLKNSIEEKVRRQGKEKREVKTGYGGIRDVEFIVQFYQLLYGGMNSTLRTSNTLEGLRRLTEYEILKEEDAHTLKEGYIFLRELEHRLQFYAQSQTHELPDDEQSILKIAMRMQINRDTGIQLFRDKYDEVTRSIRSVFETIFKNIFTEEELPIYDLFSEYCDDDEKVKVALSHYGFEDSKAIYKTLYKFEQDLSGYQRNVFINTLPQILEHVSKLLDPDDTLRRLLSIIEAYGAKGIFIELLSKDKTLTKALVGISARSNYLSQIVQSNPSFIDEIFYGSYLNETLDKEQLHDVFRRIFEFYKNYPAAFRTFKKLEELRIGLKELIDINNSFDASTELSFTADIILEEACSVVLSSLPSSFPAAIIKLGRLGSNELNFGSDMDLVFVYKHCDYTRENKYYIDAFQKLLNMLGKSEGGGAVYEIDLRLRPYGGQSSIAVPSANFMKYYEDTAQLWEKILYSKARVYSNDKTFERELSVFFKNILEELNEVEAASEMYSMRQKVLMEFKRKSSGLNFKKGEGALFDIDFIFQYFIIKYIKKTGDYWKFDRVRLFKLMYDWNFLSESEYNSLVNAYAFFHKLEIITRLKSSNFSSLIKKDSREEKIISFELGFGESKEGIAKMKEVYRLHSQNVVKIFSRLLKKQ